MKHVWWLLLVSGCVCEPGQQLCGPSCSDLASDPMNCGSCGFACVGTCTSGYCDPAGACSDDSGCDDGLACNGQEWCESASNGASFCRAGSPHDCADRHDCTRDTCVEPGECRHALDDALCADGICTEAGCESCDEAPCRLRSPQCGCHDGESCQPVDGVAMCAPYTGGSGLLEACFADADCEPGMMCVTTGVGAVCMTMCQADRECPEPEEQCFSLGIVAEPVHGVCSANCDIVRQTGCGVDGCVLIGSSEEGYGTSCGDTGSVAVGGPCVESNDCRSALCINTPGGATCRTWCYGATDCPSGSVCSDIAETIVVGGRRLRYCRPT